MAQPAVLPEGPQAVSPVAPVSPAAVPPSPTRSIWRRFLMRSGHAHADAPPKGTPVAPSPQPSKPPPPASAAPVEPSPSLLPPSPPPELSTAPNSASKTDELGACSAAVSDDGCPPLKQAGSSSRRVQRDVVPGLPRQQTFARQISELRENLMPVLPTPEERRATSTDWRLTRSVSSPAAAPAVPSPGPRASAPTISHKSDVYGSDFDVLAPSGVSTTADGDQLGKQVAASEAKLGRAHDINGDRYTMNTDPGPTSQPEPAPSFPSALPDPPATLAPPALNPVASDRGSQHSCEGGKHASTGEADARLAEEEAELVDTASMTSSQYDQRIRYELENVWILNLSMHFRDKSRREKFFVTYRQRPDLTRRVTISLDYRNPPENSLEMDLLQTKLQRDKIEMIYEAIRESLVDIQFYNTVTNLKLQTTNGRLHVHVVEDVNEIIDYPSGQCIQHLSCRKIRERDVEFDSHMSGFVYKVRVDGQMLIKKEIPGPDSVDEFLYEVNALNFLHGARNVIELYGVTVDDDGRIKGLLISYAEQGALIDILYENNHGIAWLTRMKWARQIVLGLSEIHEAGFVQGDFTLSNIVIDNDGNAKIIDINRRGCPVGWEPPEATPLIQSDQRISMYIGVKSDLYQLGMVLWALATQDDNPEAHARPLVLAPDVGVPQWYRTIVETCLAENPRVRAQARQLLSYFPQQDEDVYQIDDSDYDDDWVNGPPPNPSFYAHSAPSGSTDDVHSAVRRSTEAVGDWPRDGTHASPAAKDDGDWAPRIRTATPSNGWSCVNLGHTYVDAPNGVSNEPYYYPTRGRSPPRPVEGAGSGGCGSLPRAASWARTTRSWESRSPSRSEEKREEAIEDRKEQDKKPGPEHEERSSSPVQQTSDAGASAPAALEKASSPGVLLERENVETAKLAEATSVTVGA